jgi:hypothetical protein
MRQAFGAIGGESVDPSQKARILAEGIAAAMNCAAWGVLQGIYAVVLLFFLRRSLPDDDGTRDPSVTPRGKISGPYSPPGGDAPE